MNFSNYQNSDDNPVRATLANWRTSPSSKWAFHNVREIVPSAEILNNPKAIWRLRKIPPTFDTETLTSLIDKTSTDAVVVVHNSEIVFETYRNGMKPLDQHILFSVSKSVLGLIAGCLIKDNYIKECDLITDYIPEMTKTAFVGATIRDALDMRIGVDFDEDYNAQDGPIIDYRYATNWNPTPDSKVKTNLKNFLTSLTKSKGAHGKQLNYVSPSTDLLAWLFERASNRRYTNLVSDYIWKPMGAERSAYITVDRIGSARAAGGICATARDLARLGMVVAKGGILGSKQIVPTEWIDDLFEGGSRAAWDNGSFKDFFSSTARQYRSKWYACNENGKLLHGFGIHGQYLFVDLEKKLSIAWFSSEEDALNEHSTQKILTMVDHIRKAVPEA